MIFLSHNTPSVFGEHRCEFHERDGERCHRSAMHRTQPHHSEAESREWWRNLFFFLVEFTNRGKASCSMSGVPHAQAVDGPKRTAVGAAAKYVSLSGAPRRGLVVLHAHGGKAYVEYYVVNETDWTTKLCRPDTARGVILSPVSNWGFYIPISRLGATEVCTKRVST